MNLAGVPTSREFHVGAAGGLWVGVLQTRGKMRIPSHLTQLSHNCAQATMRNESNPYNWSWRCATHEPTMPEGFLHVYEV